MTQTQMMQQMPQMQQIQQIQQIQRLQMMQQQLAALQAQNNMKMSTLGIRKIKPNYSQTNFPKTFASLFPKNSLIYLESIFVQQKFCPKHLICRCLVFVV